MVGWKKCAVLEKENPASRKIEKNLVNISS